MLTGPARRPAGSWPIIVGGEEVGTLTAVGSEPLSALEFGMVRYGARLIAVEVVARRAAEDVDRRDRAELLNQLLAGGDT